MLFSLIVFSLEFLLCNLIISPTNSVDHTAVSIALLIINTVIVYFSVSTSIRNSDNIEEEHNVRMMVLPSFFIRIAILLWDVYARHIFILPNSEADAEWYHKIAVSFAFGSRANQVDYRKYSYYIGKLYRFIGVQKITIQFLHVFFAMWSIVLIYKILVRFKIDTGTRRRAMLFACFLPNLMMITTFFLQESVIAFLIILSLYFYTRWWFGDGLINIIWSVVASVSAAMLHLGGIVVAIGIIALMVLTANKDRIMHLTPVKAVFVIFVVLGLILVLTTFGDELLTKIGGKVDYESITGEVELKEAGGSVYTIGISGLPPVLDLLVNTPIRMVYFVFSPLPWTWRGLKDILAFFGSVLFYIYVIYTVVQALIRKPLRNLGEDSISSYYFVIIVILMIASVMFGWGVANAGTALRHREKFTYLFIIQFAISKEIILRIDNKDAKKSISNSSNL